MSDFKKFIQKYSDPFFIYGFNSLRISLKSNIPYCKAIMLERRKDIFEMFETYVKKGLTIEDIEGNNIFIPYCEYFDISSIKPVLRFDPFNERIFLTGIYNKRLYDFADVTYLINLPLMSYHDLRYKVIKSNQNKDNDILYTFKSFLYKLRKIRFMLKN